MSERQRMDIKSFRALGYLQELNRRFLHLFGLALEVVLDQETGKETLGGIWEVRDPDGIIFDLENSDEERRRTFLIKKKYIDSELDVRSRARRESLGFVVEPVPGDANDYDAHQLGVGRVSMMEKYIREGTSVIEETYDDWIELWNESTGTMSFLEFSGLTPFENAKIVEQKATLEEVIRYHRTFREGEKDEVVSETKE